ncbi:MAG TPA: diguanylate cyclase [bacterium]|nr:diguanylate cyclase [bacterium]
MNSLTDLLGTLHKHCGQDPVTPDALKACCTEINGHFGFDSVFLARAGAPEETLSPLVLEGKEEVMETCLYRLGVEERIALAKTPIKTYQDMTGKPVFNKAGSLRIQKPNSGIFQVLYHPGKIYLLFGCAHQNSQKYENEVLTQLGEIWASWNVFLLEALERFDHPKATPLPPPAPPPVLEPTQGTPEAEPAAPHTNDGRRPLVLVDEETRLFNREYFSECLGIEVERAKRYSRNLSLMFLSVSPVPGKGPEAAERKTATQITEILSKSLRRVDIICRIEKDKYGLILPDTANNTYGIIAKRVFKHFKQVMGDAPPIFLNISACTFPKHAADHIGLLDNAEKLLAQAKDVGPNKAVLPE